MTPSSHQAIISPGQSFSASLNLCEGHIRHSTTMTKMSLKIVLYLAVLFTWPEQGVNMPMEMTGKRSRKYTQ